MFGYVYQINLKNSQIGIGIRVFLNLGFAKPRFRNSVPFHENDGNHENDENDEDNSDSDKQGY